MSTDRSFKTELPQVRSAVAAWKKVSNGMVGGEIGAMGSQSEEGISIGDAARALSKDEKTTRRDVSSLVNKKWQSNLEM